MKPRQFELPKAGLGDVFNLAPEVAPDPWRLERESWEAARRREAALEYETKMQRTLAECPGFAACDAPSGPESRGKVVIEPGRIVEALPWLKRRFFINESLELSDAAGLVVEIQPRTRKAGQPTRRRVSFAPVEQFTLDFESDKQ